MALLSLQTKTFGAAMLVAALVATACLDGSRDNAGDPLREWAASVCEVAESLAEASRDPSPGRPESAVRAFAEAVEGYRAIESVPGTEEFTSQLIAAMEDIRAEFSTTIIPLLKNATPGSAAAREGIDLIVELSRRNGERSAAGWATLPEEAIEALRAVADGCGLVRFGDQVPAGFSEAR